jgi:hypothetical protein
MNFRGIALALAAAFGLSLGFGAVCQAQQQAAGVEVDPSGVLRMVYAQDPTGRLTTMRLAEARAKLDGKLAEPTEMRKISLQRLEAAVQEKLASGAPIPDEMRYLAGLTRVQYVFYYPETKDIVIAGPAEPFGTDLAGRPVGIATGSAIVELQDLIAALRAYSPQGDRTSVISVSIDPTKEGLARMQDFLRKVGRNIVPGDTSFIVSGLKESLGQQNVTIRGVPAETHFAQVLVEADYRMKLIGIGLEQPAAKIPSYVSRSNPAAVSRNALQRWYFVPNYECVRASEDDLAMELVGRGVKLVGQAELVSSSGEREESGRGDMASKAFTNAFTNEYETLAKNTPVYAQLRNLIDLSVVAAYVQRNDWYEQSGWSMDFFGDESKFAIQTYVAPAKVETAVNAVWKGSTLVTPIGGGVRIKAEQALDQENLLADEQGALAEKRASVNLSDLPAGQWWWD